MIYQTLKKYFDGVVKVNNKELTPSEKENFHLFEFPMNSREINSLDMPMKSCSWLDFVTKKEYQFLKNIFDKKEIANLEHLKLLQSYYDALVFLLNAFPYIWTKSQWITNTVKPLYSGHHWDREKVSAIDRCLLWRGSSQICLFCSKNRYFATKTCFWVLGHCKIDTIPAAWWVFEMCEWTHKQSWQTCHHCGLYKFSQ